MHVVQGPRSMEDCSLMERKAMELNIIGVDKHEGLSSMNVRLCRGSFPYIGTWARTYLGT
jgi:hypothetical protein